MRQYYFMKKLRVDDFENVTPVLTGEESVYVEGVLAEMALEKEFKIMGIQLYTMAKKYANETCDTKFLFFRGLGILKYHAPELKNFRNPKKFEEQILWRARIKMVKNCL